MSHLITICNDGPVETARDTYRRMITDELGPRLQALGFTAPQPHLTSHDTPPAVQIIGQSTFADPTPAADFRLDVPGHHALLGPQEYWGNNSASFQFTINVLATSHTSWEAFRTKTKDFTGNPWPAEPNTSTHYGPGGPWTQRLGPLMGLGDRWWYISPRRPTETIADEIATAVQQYALPAIHQHTQH